MTSLRYIPGQIVAFSTSSMQTTFDETYLSAFGEPLASNTYVLSSGLHYLELYGVNSGEELRFLDYVRTQPGVIAASLNYIGFGLTETYIQEATQPELAYQPGLMLSRDLQCFLLPQGNDSIHIHNCDYDELVRRLEAIDPTYLIAAIDVSPEHCQQVMRLIVEGLNHKYRDSDLPLRSSNIATIVGLTSNIDNSTMTDLFGFASRLALLADLVGPNTTIDSKLVSINMSVDFSQIIFGYNTLDPVSAESPDMVFSLPFFEKTLTTIVSNLRVEDQSYSIEDPTTWCPAIFASAGNRVVPGGDIRIRLAYPAIRPETIATTFVTSDPIANDVVRPVDWVDVPASTGLKPCFAIDVKQMALTVFNGSSFASAWLAGYYAALVYWNEDDVDVEYLGLLSKVAWLMRWTERQRLPSGIHRLPCFVAVIRDKMTYSRSPWDMDELITDLVKEFKADFCLHGSSATVGEWLRLNKRHLTELEPWVKKDLGDIDLLYSGKIADASVEDVKRFVRDWFKQRLGRSWVTDRKRLVELHPYEGLVSAAERLRSVTPAIKLYITLGGVIDTWGGLEDLEQREIRFFPLTDLNFWTRNSLFSSGADCLALNILQWISIITLLQLVSHALGVPGPVAHQDSLDQVQKIIDQAYTSDEYVLLFGYRPSDIRERLDRRFERVETLMGSCARQRIIDNALDRIFMQLYHLQYSPRQTQ